MLRVFCIALLLCTQSVAGAALSQTLPPLVALASSFRGPWPDLMKAYQSETGQAEPRTSFASSGLLTTQIRHGAPFELFLSADQMTVRQLQSLGKTQDRGVMLASGYLSLVWQSRGEPLAPTDTRQMSATDPAPVAGLDALVEKLEKAESFKLAMPNPRHAPYGIAARQALASAGLWPLPPGYVLNAENAEQTLQFALSGAVDFAIIPDTLVAQLPDTLQKAPLDPAGYAAVIHQMVLLTPAGPAAHKLFDWLQSESAAAILTRYGLTPEH